MTSLNDAVPAAASGDQAATMERAAFDAPADRASERSIGDGPANATEALGDEIARLSAHINAATYRLLVLLHDFDEQGGWATFNSCAHWLSWRTGISLGPAREKVRVARRLPSLPLISAAFKTGDISYSKVRAMTRIADADNEAMLLDFARHGTASHVERMVRHWRRIDRCDESIEQRDEGRELMVWLDDDGSYHLRGRLSPEVGGLLVEAIEAAERKLYLAEREAGAEPGTSGPQRRADALGLWLEERVQPHVQLVVNAFEVGPASSELTEATGTKDATNADDLSDTCVPSETCKAPETLVGTLVHDSATAPDAPESAAVAAAADPNPVHPRALALHPTLHDACCSPDRQMDPSLAIQDGSRVSAETSARLACDADVVRVRRAEDGSVLDVGRRERFVGWRLRKALEARDGGCRFPGCGSRMRNHAHHVVPWAKGGETALRNLVLLCPFHHRAVHEGGWGVEMDDSGVPRFFNPLGVPVPDAPRAPRTDAGTVDPGTALARWHGRKDIGPGTGRSLWQGDRIDWAWAMACLKAG